MKKTIKRIISGIAVMALMLSLIPVTAKAVTYYDVTRNNSDISMTTNIVFTSQFGGGEIGTTGADNTRAEQGKDYTFTVTDNSTTPVLTEPYEITYTDDGSKKTAQYVSAGTYKFPAPSGAIIITKIASATPIAVLATDPTVSGVDAGVFKDGKTDADIPASSTSSITATKTANYEFYLELTDGYWPSKTATFVVRDDATPTSNTETITYDDFTIDGNKVCASVDVNSFTGTKITITATDIKAARTITLPTDQHVTFVNDDTVNPIKDNKTLTVADGDSVTITANPQSDYTIEGGALASVVAKPAKYNDYTTDTTTPGTTTMAGTKFTLTTVSDDVTVSKITEIVHTPNTGGEAAATEDNSSGEDDGTDENGTTDEDGKTDEDGTTDEDGKTDDGSADGTTDGDNAGATGFADDSDIADYAKPYIKSAAEAGIIKGVGDNRFDPKGSATRAAFSTMIARAKGLTAAKGSSKFADVTLEALGEDLLNGVIACEDLDPAIVQGYPDGSFQPTKAVTRAEGILMIWRAAGSPAYSGADKFDDLADWYKDAANWGAEQGIVNGVGDGKFDGGATLTRQDLATMLGRAIEKGVIKVATPAATDDASAGTASGEGTTSEGDAAATEGDAAATDGDKAAEGTESESASDNAA